MEKRKFEGDKYILEIERDIYPENPRELCDNFGTMICWHRDYDLGDENDYDTPQDFNEDRDKMAVVLPLYLMDHSVLSMSTRSFACPWDSGQVGYIYITKENLIKEYGSYSDENIKKAKEMLEAEVETYNSYLEGDVYIYTVFEKMFYIKKYDDETKEDEIGYDLEEIDSCCGFYGDDIFENGIIGHIEEEVLEDIGLERRDSVGSSTY